MHTPSATRKLAPKPVEVEELEELSLDDLLEDDDMDEAVAAAATANSTPPDRLGLDRFDEDSEVKPVVLLSPKRKRQDKRSDGAFMSDLERRLEEDADSDLNDLARLVRKDSDSLSGKS